MSAFFDTVDFSFLSGSGFDFGIDSGSVLQFAAAVDAKSQANAIDLLVARLLVSSTHVIAILGGIDLFNPANLIAFATTCNVQVDFAAAALMILRHMSAGCISQTELATVIFATARPIAASVGVSTFAAAVDLILAGLGAIADTELLSVTVRRHLASQTVNRTIEPT